MLAKRLLRLRLHIVFCVVLSSVCAGAHLATASPPTAADKPTVQTISRPVTAGKYECDALRETLLSLREQARKHRRNPNRLEAIDALLNEACDEKSTAASNSLAQQILAILESDREAVESYNGILTAKAPAAGMLLAADGDVPLTGLCSGTLVGPTTFVTAAHCFLNKSVRTPSEVRTTLPKYRVFFQNAGIFRLTEVEFASEARLPTSVTRSVFDATRPSDTAHLDIAIARLGTPATGILPARLVDDPAWAPAKTSTLYGFGITGYGLRNVGIKRHIMQNIQTCSPLAPTLPRYDGLICWKALTAASCPGDSGAGHIDELNLLIGVHHGKPYGSPGCDELPRALETQETQWGVAVRVAPHKKFISDLRDKWNSQLSATPELSLRGAMNIDLVGREGRYDIQVLNLCYLPAKDVLCEGPNVTPPLPYTGAMMMPSDIDDWQVWTVPKGTKLVRLALSAEAWPVRMTVVNGLPTRIKDSAPTALKLRVRLLGVRRNHGKPEQQVVEIQCAVGADPKTIQPGHVQFCEIPITRNDEGEIHYQIERVRGGGLAQLVITHWWAD